MCQNFNFHLLKLILEMWSQRHHARTQKVLSEGVQLNFDNVFFIFWVNEGREDPNTCTTKSGISSVHKRNGVSLAGQ